MKYSKPFSVYAHLPKEMYILFISRVINSMGHFIMPLLTLILTQKISYSASQAGLFSTVAALTQVPFLLLGGKLVDRFGSKKIIIIFNTLGSLMYLLCSQLPIGSTTVLLIIVASNLHAVAHPGFNTYVAIIVPHDQLKRAYSLMYLGFNLGLAVGPMLGGLLFENHLSLLFFLDGLCALSATALLLGFIKDRRAEKIADNAGMDRKDISLIGFFRKNYLLLLFGAILLVYNFCYAQWYFILPMQTAAIFPNGVAFYGFLVSVNAAIVIVLTPFLTYATRRIKPLLVAAGGGILYAVSFGMFGFNAFKSVFLAAIFILTIGEILITINTNTYIAQRTPENFLGRVNSVIMIISGAGSAVGPLVSGSFLGLLGFGKTWLAVSVLMFIGAASMLLMPNSEVSSRKADS